MRKLCVLTSLIAVFFTARMVQSQPTAAFSYFKYEGKDAFYEEHPLSDPTQYYNPILPGWYSDPSICYTDKGYFMVTSTFGYFPGIPIFYSQDLLNWQQIGHVLNREEQLPYLKGQSIDHGGIYAPQITYNRNNGLYYVITTDVGHGSFFVTTENPFNNNWSNPIWLPEIDGIDPSFFFDDNGEAYIVHKEDITGQPKQNDHRAIRICRFDPITGKTFGEDEPMKEEGAREGLLLDRDEGPHIYKKDGFYYLVCAEGGTGTNHSAVVYRSKEVMGVWQRWENNPMITQRDLPESRENEVTCSGHADLVEDQNGNWWAVFLACRPLKNGLQSLGRETFMLPVTWNNGEFPYILPHKEAIPLIGKVPGATRNSTPSFGNFTKHTTFNAPTLDHEWISLRGAVPYSIENGKLILSATDDSITTKGVPAYIARRIQHHIFSVETTVNIVSGSTTNAGLLIFKNENKHYFLAVSNKEITLKADKRILAKTQISTSNDIKLKVISNGLTYTFLYSVGNEWQTLTENIDADYTSSKAGGFCGTVIGLYVE